MNALWRVALLFALSLGACSSGAGSGESSDLGDDATSADGAVAEVGAGEDSAGDAASDGALPDSRDADGDGSRPDSDDSSPSDGGDVDDMGESDDLDVVDADGGPACGTERIRQDLAIPTIDGHSLSAFVDRPAREGCALPTILVQTPYDKESAWSLFFGVERSDRPLFDSPDYNFVVVDWRGRFGSSGLPNANRGVWLAQDSYDTVEWIADQPWSDGKVGTWGVSALCGAQYRTAAGPTTTASNPDFNNGPPPHLAAMVPIMCSIRPSYRQAYPGGVLRHEWASGLDVLGFGVRPLYEGNPRENFLWDIVGSGSPVERMAVPALVVSGWWDLMPNETIAGFDELVEGSAVDVRGQHRLLIGPWIHFATGGAVSSGSVAALEEEELPYMDADRVIDQRSLAFFDHHLRGIDNEVTDWAPVRYHHENEGWKDAQQWPPRGADGQTLYLSASGLVGEAPDDESLSFPYDPADPSPTIGGSTLSPYLCLGHPNPLSCTLGLTAQPRLLHGPLSQAALLERGDHLVFSTGDLGDPLALLGPIEITVELATTGADTDLAVRVLDIDETGDPRLIGEGIQRLSARDDDRGYSEVVANQRYTLEVEVTKDFAYTLAAGHELAIMLSASNWPLYARNPGDGAVFFEDDVADGTPETFSYGTPATDVTLRGAGASLTNTVFLDGTSRIVIHTVGE